MHTVHVAGGGVSAFAHHWETPLVVLAARAIREAFEEAGIDRDAVDSVYVGHMSQGELIGQRLLRDLAFPEVPVVNVENACASGGTALREAWLAIAAGASDIALVLGVEKLASKGLLRMPNPTLEERMGFIMPGSYALAGQAHMERYGTTREQFAKVAAKNRNNGVRNPIAMFRKPCTVEDVLGSRPIADPLTLLQCCAPASGVAAAVLIGDRKARETGVSGGVRIAGSALGSRMNRGLPEDVATFAPTARAARKAYEIAGIGPEEVDVVELHDAFSIGELLHYESLALCPAGEGGRMIDEGHTEIGGRVPVNPSGGLLARGHPVGATGVAQIVELRRQLLGKAGPTQAGNPRVALAQCQGGTGAGAGAAVVSLLCR